jgi:hypothetical protein
MQKCSTREYRNISKIKIDMIITEAVSQGAIIAGSNPWTVDTSLHGTVLRVTWDEKNMTMAVTVVRANWYIQCEMVWKHIDALLHGPVEQRENLEGVIGFG